uniref:uncharacterized protein n=1 Tax=Pristiophorus japonicus TaxID=55135 RepID=UPI00398F138B
MADPIMDLFDDPGLFAEGLDSLTAGSIADDLDLGDGFEPLEPGPELAKAHPFDGLPQFHQPARDGDHAHHHHHHHHASYTIFSALKSPGESFDDQSPLWAQPAPERVHELPPPPPPAPPPPPPLPPASSQEAEYLAHHDYALQQSQQQQQQTPLPAPVPTPVPPQPALDPFSQAQDALSQGNPFMGAHGAQKAAVAVRKALTPAPPPPPPPPPAPAPVETPAFPGPGQQTVSVASSTSSPAQYNIRYSLSAPAVPNGGVAVPPGTVLASSQAVSYISGNAVFTTASGGQGQGVQANGPSLNQVLLQPVTAQATQGNFTTATLTTVKPNVTIAPSPASQ